VIFWFSDEAPVTRASRILTVAKFAQKLCWIFADQNLFRNPDHFRCAESFVSKHICTEFLRPASACAGKHESASSLRALNSREKRRCLAWRRLKQNPVSAEHCRAALALDY
jgi:hypothetical protein